jgi:hypothetical protein
MTWTQPTLLLLMNPADATRNNEQLPCEQIDLLEKLNLIVSFVLSAKNGYSSVKTALTVPTLGFNTVESVWQDSESSLFFFLSLSRYFLFWDLMISSWVILFKPT